MKKIKYLLFSLVLSVLFLPTALASSATVGVKVSSNQVVVGKNITVTVTVSSADPLGSWEYILNYDKSLVTLTSTNVAPKVVDYASGPSTKSQSYTYTFKTNKKGSAKFSISGANVVGFDESRMSVNNGSKTVSIITQAELEASYSTNNNLSSLSVEGYELKETFNKDTLEYSLDIDSEVKQINILAKKADGKSSVTGTGKKDLTEGLNKFEITVTSQKGTTKTYVLNVNVKELNPIIVTVNGKNYSIVKKSSYLTIPENYEVTTYLYHEEEIEVLHNKELDYTLIGLKNEEGSISLYKYTEKNDTFTLYKEFTFNKIILTLLDHDLALKGYTKTTIKIDKQEIDALEYKGISDFVLIYGVDTSTGKEGYYQYDKKNNIIQLYNENLVNKLNDEKQNYLYITILFGGCLLLAIIIVFIQNGKNRKLNKIVNEIREKVEDNKEKKKTK